MEAETLPDISESFDIEAVPSFIILKVRDISKKKTVEGAQNGICKGHTLLARISGADAPALTQAVEKHAAVPAYTILSHTNNAPAKAPTVIPAETTEGGETETEEQLEKRLRGLMNQSKVVLFMKGSPDVPRCGFSRKIVDLLKDQGIQFKHFDILTDESVRQGWL